MIVREMMAHDMDWVLNLNMQHETELSPLDAPGLVDLTGTGFACLVAGEDAGFLISLSEISLNESPNFLWFRERYDRFVYVDRVCVSPQYRRMGLADQLYDGLFAEAVMAGQTRICCEVNADPPNPGSDAFHAARGFQVVGERHLEDRDKTVRYMVCELA
ncbi:MAG: GNAT family N-acetyltransferase [Pseudomonadota bacterium]